MHLTGLLAQHGIDGVIWCPVGPNVPSPLRTLDRPAVLIDLPKPGFAAVHSNYRLGGQLLGRYALQQGHTRIGLLSGPTSLESARQRPNGFLHTFPRQLQIAREVRAGFDVIHTRAARDTTVAQPLAAIGTRAVELLQERMAGAGIPAHYWRGRFNTHIPGVLGGVIWGIGMSLNLIASDRAGFAMSYGLGQGATMIAALWGVFVWREFRNARAGTPGLLAAMFVCFILGLALIVLARTI